MTSAGLPMFSRLLFACSLALAAPSAATPRQQPPRLVLTDDDTELHKALTSPAPQRDLPVRLAALSLPADDPAAVRLLIVAAIDDEREGVPLASVAYALLDEKGETRAHALRRVGLRRTSSGWLSFNEVVSVPPGSYRLRLAAMRNTRVGSGEVALVARIQAASSVRLGDLLIGEVAGDEATTDVTPEHRVHGDRLVVSLPVGVGQAMPPGIAMTLDVATGAAGASLLTAPLSLLPGEGSLRLAQAVADARVLPPGDYLATVSVSLPGSDVARVVAPFAIDRATGAAAAGVAPRDARPVWAGVAAASPRAGNATTSPGVAPGFRLEDVLDAAVLGPFLDELATRAPERARPAIEQAKAGQFAEAAQAAASKDPNDPARPFLQGLSLLSRRQLQEASQAFRETVAAAPDYFVGAFYIGACYAAGGKDPQAVNAWQTSLVGLDQYPIVFRMLGEALSRMGQPDRAVQTLEEASAKWPDDRGLRLRLARAALDARRYDRVTAAVDAALVRASADFDLLFLGMQAIFERVTQGTGAQADDLARLNRYREAYAAAGGPRQPLVNEWVTAVEKKVSPAR